MQETVERPLSRQNQWLAPTGPRGWESEEWESTAQDLEAKQVGSSKDEKSLSDSDVKELPKEDTQQVEVTDYQR